MSYYGLVQAKEEQTLKKKFGAGLASSDVNLNGKNVAFLLIFSFLGGWVSGALGLGGGAVFNPLLLSMGVPPRVSSATGMYMIIFSTAASTLSYYLNGLLIFNYGLFVGFFCVLGTYIGMVLLEKMMGKQNKQSYLVFLLSFVLGLSAVAVVFFGVGTLDLGSSKTWQYGSICT
jgi:uncharacterized membrane protein YfcA